ncbi:MAG: hypothetical protein ACKVG0_11515, partial [Alphaproteobacteria bacterium]
STQSCRHYASNDHSGITSKSLAHFEPNYGHDWHRPGGQARVNSVGLIVSIPQKNNNNFAYPR